MSDATYPAANPNPDTTSPADPGTTSTPPQDPQGEPADPATSADNTAADQ